MKYGLKDQRKNWRQGTALCLATTIVMAAPAEARRDPAPIVYAEQGDQPAPASGKKAAPAAVKTGKRIEFRYPDRPELAYGTDGVRQVEADAPLAFSSSTSAIAPEAARRYAHTEPPRASGGVNGLDPSITSSGFDARATAARIAAAKPPTPAQKPAPVAAVDAPSSYSVRGVSFSPEAGRTYDETGIASWYGPGFHGKPTANGEIFDQEAMTAAHPTLPLPSLVQVVNLKNGQEVVLRVNDRGPFIEGRMIDVSRRAAEILGFEAAGQTQVRVRYLGPAAVGGPQASSGQTYAPKIQPITAAPVIAQSPLPVPDLNLAPTLGMQGHFVQLGSFANIANAERLRASLDATLPVDIEQARVRNADFFRVRVGPFASRSRAEQVRGELAQRGLADGIVLTEATGA